MKVDVPRLLARLGVEPSSTGVETWARCPFPDHEDRTPSFQIHDEPGDERNGWFSCHGCGRKGGVLDLVVGLGKARSLAEARAWLRRNGAESHELNAFGEVKSTSSLYRRSFRMPPEVFFGPLEEWPGPPRGYLVGRGVTPEQVDRWGIGYAVSGVLQHRVVLPKRDPTGKLVGYTARSYLHKPEKPYIEPGAKEGADPFAVWGEQHWPAGERGTLVVDEGAFNALAIERVAPYGWCVGAVSGAGRVGEALAKVATFARVLVRTDSDDAGEKAAAALQMGCPSSIVRRLVTPGTDPNLMDPSELFARLREVQW